METGGWVLMLVSWSTIAGLAGFCLWKVLRTDERPSDGDPKST